MRALVFLIAVLCIASVHAHTAIDPKSLEHDHADNSTQDICNPADPVNENPALWTVTFLLIGAVVLSIAALRNSAMLSILGILIMAGMLVYAWHSLELNEQTVHFGAPGSDHIHADFAVMVDNQLVDFTNDHFMTYYGQIRSVYVHLHDTDSVVHAHATNVTWRYFFDTLAITLDEKCLAVKGTPICGAVFIRNGEETPGLLDMSITEADRVLFHYGGGNASILFNQAVGDRACMHSGTCPERGLIPGCSSAEE